MYRVVLEGLFPNCSFGVEKPSQKLQDPAGLDADTFIAEVRKARGKAKPLGVADVKRLRDE